MDHPIARSYQQVSGSKLSGPERAFVLLLQQRMLAGEIVWWSEHPWNLRLGENLRYEPDFAAVLPDGVIEVYEVKGPNGFAGTRFNGGSTGSGGLSRAKFLACVEAYPLFQFVLARRRKVKDRTGPALIDEWEMMFHAPRRGFGHGAVAPSPAAQEPLSA